MFDNILNASALTLIVAIGAVIACSTLQAPTAHGGRDAPALVARPATAASEVAETRPMVYGTDADVQFVELPAAVLQLPTVVIVGRRDRSAEPSTMAAAD